VKIECPVCNDNLLKKINILAPKTMVCQNCGNTIHAKSNLKVKLSLLNLVFFLCVSIFIYLLKTPSYFNIVMSTFALALSVVTSILILIKFTQYSREQLQRETSISVSVVVLSFYINLLCLFSLFTFLFKILDLSEFVKLIFVFSIPFLYLLIKIKTKSHKNEFTCTKK